ncbi:hypothetical protein EDD15DRAFT_2518144 [Pisolithus albus]|nr:hypothetical protein EDD15DRAFT_2518144 [Pisolithus albus]
MARTQSKKRRLLGFVKTSYSTPGPASPPGRADARAGDFATIPEKSGMASSGRLARMRRFFYRSKQGPSTAIATEIVDTQADGGTQEQRHQSQVVVPDQDFDGQPATTSTSGRPQEQQKQSQAGPTKDVCDL